MNYYLIEYYDFRNLKTYTFKIYANNEYDAWNMCLYENDYKGYELGRGELMSNNLLITNIIES